MSTLAKYCKRSAVIAVSIAVTAALTGCAADASSAGGNSKASSQQTIEFRTTAAVGSPVSNYPDIEAAGAAAAKAINKAGGINGATLKVSFCNTRGDANQSMTCSRQAVEDGVVAVVSRSDSFSEQSVPITAAAGIPELGIFAQSQPIEATGANSYPLTAGNFGNFNAIPYACKEAGYKNFGIVTLDLAGGHTQAELAVRASAEAGIKNVGTVMVPVQGVTDYTPYVQNLKELGADCALLILGPAHLQAFYKAAKAIGSHIQFGGTLNSFSESEAEPIGAAADGVWVASAIPSVRDTSVPAMKQYNQELDAAGVANDPVLRRVAGFNAWLAVHAGAEVAKTIKGKVTAAKLTTALDKTRDLDLFGLMSWSPSEFADAGGTYPRLPTSDVYIYEFKGGKLVPASVKKVSDPLAGLR